MQDRNAGSEVVFHLDLCHHVRHTYLSDGVYLLDHHVDPNEAKGTGGHRRLFHRSSQEQGTTRTLLEHSCGHVINQLTIVMFHSRMIHISLRLKKNAVRLASDTLMDIQAPQWPLATIN